MGNINSEQQKGHFMSGFTLGTLAGGTALFLFGTKRGRAVLSNLMDIAEQLEEGKLDLSEIIDTDEVKDKVMTTVSGGGLADVLEKIQEAIPAGSIKKYFVKDEG